MGLDPQAVRLDDHVALVTGAAVGIGRAIACAFARFGADLALCDRDAAGLAETGGDVESTGRRVLTAELDVRDPEAVDAFLARVGEHFGRVDTLVNNAGGGFRSDFFKVSARGEEALVRENFSSVTHFVRGVAPLVPEGGGSIINLTSVEAHRAAPGFAVYAAMKSAVASLTRSLALELGGRGVRVNCIAPDLVETPGTGPIDVAPPLAREGTPDDVAGAAVFLASDLSRFVTGTTIHVDGGSLAAGGWRRGEGGAFGL